jgi:hypothetical protein
VFEPGRGTRFVEEPDSFEVVGADVGWQELERDGPIEAGVARLVDDTLPPSPIFSSIS